MSPNAWLLYVVLGAVLALGGLAVTASGALPGIAAPIALTGGAMTVIGHIGGKRSVNR